MSAGASSRKRAALSLAVVAVAIVAAPSIAGGTVSLARGRIIAGGGLMVLGRPVQFYGTPGIDRAGGVSDDVQTGFSPNTQELRQAVLYFQPDTTMQVVAGQGQAVPGAPSAAFVRFNNVRGIDGVPFFGFTTDVPSSGVARFFQGAVEPLLGTGAPSDGTVQPGDFVAAQTRLFVAAGDRLASVVPSTKTFTEVIRVGDMLDGRVVTAVSSTQLFPLAIEPTGTLATAVLTLDGSSDAVTRFNLQTGSAMIALAENGPAPGFPAGVTIRFLLNSADINANGDWSVQTRLMGSGITDANDFTLFFFDGSGVLLGRVQEGMQVPDAAPGTTVALPAPPLQGPTRGGAFLPCSGTTAPATPSRKGSFSANASTPTTTVNPTRPPRATMRTAL